MRTGHVVFALALVTSILAACAPEPWDPTPLSDEGVTPTTTPAGECAGPATLEAMDPSKLPACCSDGAAHCVPSDKVPGAYRSSMDTCNGGGGSCIPDALIKSGGAAPPTCKTTLAGKEFEGACLSVCIPQIAKQKALLNKGSCAGGADIVCAPCIHPLENKPTGACDIGKKKSNCTSDAGPVDTAPSEPTCPYAGPLVPVDGFPECDVKGARCVPEAQVAATVNAEQRKMLATCTKGGPGYCVPEPLLERRGKYTAPTCTSVGGAEGRCLHKSIPFINERASYLPQDKCTPNELCAPCFDPITGNETGACKVGCDTGPAQPKKLFKDCCSNRAKCVPQSLVPASLAERVGVKECASNERCAPTELAAGGASYKPKSCKPSFFASLAGAKTGVCLSDCLVFDGFGESLAVTQSDCAAGEKCAPCSTADGPTGAPGCPK